MASICLVSFVPSYWIVKAGAFTIGFGFFGGPVIEHTVEFLDQNVADWKSFMDLQKYASPVRKEAILIGLGPF